MRQDRYEIEPRPVALGGGWRLHLFGRDLETGEEIEVGGCVFPVDNREADKAAYADAMRFGEDWLRLDNDKQD